MGIVCWVVIGIVFGLVARVAMPGPAAGGRPVAILIGLLGAFAGGLLGTTFLAETQDSFDLYGVGMAAIGAVYLLFLYRCIAIRFDALPPDVRNYLVTESDDTRYEWSNPRSKPAPRSGKHYQRDDGSFSEPTRGEDVMSAVQE